MYSSSLSLLPFQLTFLQQHVGRGMVWQVGIYNEGTKGGILSADTNYTAGLCHLQVRVRGAPSYMTSSRLGWVWTPSPNPLFRPLPIAGVSFLRGVFEEYSPNPPIAPGPRFLPLQIRVQPVRRPCPHRGSGPGVQWPGIPASHALPTPRNWARPSGQGHPTHPQSPHSFLISEALLQPLGCVTGAACPIPREGLGAISRKPP